MPTLDEYRSQTPMSDPGKHAALFDALPDDLTELCRTLRGLYIHYMSGSMFDWTIPPERLCEIDSRRMETIIGRIIELDPRPLTDSRPPQDRFVGCCRDASLMLCSMLRHKGIPARIRVGFAPYINIGATGTFIVDHVVAEYHDGSRWRLIDAEQSEKVKERNGITFDVEDIPRDRFLVGGAAWQMCKSGAADANSFGGDPNDNFWRGWWPIRSKLVQDILALNRIEYLLWDDWGATGYEFDMNDPDNQAFIDHLAALSASAHDKPDMDAIHAAAADPRLRVPERFMCYSPAIPPFEVTGYGLS